MATAARDNEIGRCRCPVCNSQAARLRISARHLAYITCDGCHTQAFARGDQADALMRGMHLPEQATAPKPPPDKHLQAPVAAAAAAAAHPAPARRPSWGFGGLT